MKAKLFKIVISACMAATLMLLPAGVSFAAASNPNSGVSGSAGGDAAVKNKQEVIYATLGSDGSIHAAYVVNHFEVTGAGKITDHGLYSSVENLTSTDPLEHAGDAVSFKAPEGNFYYQGNMVSTDLPWLFELSYYLGGIKTAPQDLAGKSGQLEIRISTKQNGKIDKTFYENYMLQISLTLDTEKCGDIHAPDATIASAGKNTVVSYTVMPKKDADFRLTASVKDFEMVGMQISGMPLSINMELPDTEDMTSDFDKLSDAVSDLDDGVGDLADGVKDLKKGSGKLKKGSADIKNGLAELRKNSGQLTQTSSQINGALLKMASSLKDALSGDINLDDLNRLPQGLAQLAGGLKDISGGLAELKKGFSSAYTALNDAIRGIPETAVTQAQIDALYAATDPTQHGVLDKLVASYSAGQTAKGTYNQVKDAFDSVGPTIDTLSGSIDTIAGTLNDMSSKIAETLSGMSALQQLGQLSSGLSELSENYAAFHKGLAGYMDGVAKIADGYPDFHSGLSAFDSGVQDLYDGVTELHDGTSEFKDETADMPDTFQTKIDDLMDEYTGSDFKPVSFLSSRNSNTGLVQFVLKCDAIEKPEATAKAPAERKDGTVWDRFAALFKNKEE